MGSVRFGSVQFSVDLAHSLLGASDRVIYLELLDLQEDVVLPPLLCPDGLRGDF